MFQNRQHQRRSTHAARKAGVARKETLKFKDGLGWTRTRAYRESLNGFQDKIAA